MPVPPGEIRRGRMGWAEISVVALDSRLFLTHICRAPVGARDFSALGWKPIVHKAPSEMGRDERR